MSEIGELLELLHGERRRFRSVRGVLRHWWNLSLSQQAHERWQRELREAGHAVGTSYTRVMAVDGGPPDEPPDRQEQVIRFWSEPPARLREETVILAPQAYEHLMVRDGKRWWTYSPEWGAVSNVAAGGEEEVGIGGGELWAALLDPAAWIATLDFELRGEVSVLGRRALRVNATGREPPGGDPFLLQGQLAVGADEYRLLVDRERGVVLRAAALIEGKEFWVSEFEELVFDEELPPETFVFEPPPGEEIRGPDIGLREPVTIEEAAQRASFPLFYLPELPEGRWDVHVMYAPARERPPMQESVHLAYHGADATHHLMVTERLAEAREPDWLASGLPGVQVEEVAHEGFSFTVYRPERRQGIPLTVVFAREGTGIELNSTDLDEELLLRLAASMERLPSQP